MCCGLLSSSSRRGPALHRRYIDLHWSRRPIDSRALLSAAPERIANWSYWGSSGRPVRDRQPVYRRAGRPGAPGRGRTDSANCLETMPLYFSPARSSLSRLVNIGPRRVYGGSYVTSVLRSAGQPPVSGWVAPVRTDTTAAELSPAAARAARRK